MVASDRPLDLRPLHLPLVPGEEFREVHAADLDCGGAPCPVRIVLTTRRVVLLPDAPPGRPSPHVLAGPMVLSRAAVVVLEADAEVTLENEDGAVRLQFPNRARALAFVMGVRAAA